MLAIEAASTDPPEPVVNLYQTVLNKPGLLFPVNGATQLTTSGATSPVCTVAPELSLVSVNVPPTTLTVAALARLSFVGAGATTLNVGNVTVCVVTVVPPPGGGLRTPTEFVLPKFARNAAGTVADN